MSDGLAAAAYAKASAAEALAELVESSAADALSAAGAAVAPADVVGGVLKESVAGRTRISIRNEVVWLQHEGVTVNSATDQTVAVQAALDKAATFQGAGYQGVVSGEPGFYRCQTPTTRAGGAAFGQTAAWNNITACLHIPPNVRLRGTMHGGGSSLLLADPAAGQYGINIQPSSLGTLALSDWKIQSASVIPDSYRSTKTPPSAGDAVLCDNGGVSRLFITGKFRAGLALLGDHFFIDHCNPVAWASLAIIANNVTDGDNLVEDSTLNAYFTSIYVESGRKMHGMRFMGSTHFGLGGGPHIYMPTCVAQATFMSFNDFVGSSFEGGSRGLFVNDDMNGIIQSNRFWMPQVNTPFDGGHPQATWGNGDPTQPFDAVIKALSVIDNHVSGVLLPTCGPDPTNGCVIRATTSVLNNDFGDIATALAVCDQYGLPFMRTTAQFGNTFEALSAAAPRYAGHFRTLTTAARRRDVLRPRAGAFRAGKFDSAGKRVAGVALRSGAIGAHVPVVDKGNAVEINTAHLGGVKLAAALAASPLTAPTASTTLAADLDLGSGVIAGMTLGEVVLPQATIPVTSVSDFPAAGTFGLGTQVISYTGLDTSNPNAPAFTGCTGGTGTIAGKTRISRIAFVASNSGFSATGGVVLLNGTTYATFTGVTGSDKLYGVSSAGGGIIASGATAAAVLSIKFTGQADDLPAGPASAAILTSQGTFCYEKALVDQATQTLQGWLAGITNHTGTGGNAGNTLVGGTRLSVAATLPQATITVDSTAGFPSSGTARVSSTVTFAYTGKTATTFTGCTGGTGTFAIGSPVTPYAGAAIATEVPIRPRYGTGATDADDQGLATASSGAGDTTGFAFATATAADSGGVVVADIG
jgi:hypothetical protein